MWWQSPTSRRKELLVSAAILFLLNLLISLDFRPPFFHKNSPITRDEQSSIDNQAFRKALLDGIEALEYMYDSQAGRAKVAELVEMSAGAGGKLFGSGSKQCSGPVRNEARVVRSRTWTANGDFHLYSAYLDQRRMANGLFPDHPALVRIVASSFGIAVLNRTTYFCHFRFDDPSDNDKWTGNIVQANVRWIWQRAWDPRNEFYNAFLIVCPLESEQLEKIRNGQRMAVLVSDNEFCVSSRGKGANYMEAIIPTKFGQRQQQLVREGTSSVIGLKPDEIRIAVCLKGLAFWDESELSPRWLVEWVELQRALGANSVGVYVYWVPEAVQKVLRKMEQRGRIDLVQLELPGDSPNQPLTRHNFIWRNRQQKRRHELVPYNDCFNRYASDHHFVLIVDSDEVVVPMRNNTDSWQQMLAALLDPVNNRWHSEPSSISVRNVFKFTRNKNETESMFASSQRSGVVQERHQYGKSFISTRSVATVFNHFALHRLHSNVSRTLYLDEEEALKLHWKRHCPSVELGKEACEKIEQTLVEDNNILERFRRKVAKNLNAILAENL